jgi:hypothetical protein
MAEQQWSPEREYEERLAWRKKRQIENLKELAEIAHVGGGDTLTDLPKLLGPRGSDDPKDALGWSIIMLWCEATECYIFGEFQSCILTCGAIVERSLKLEYEKARGALPQGSRWTLGRCIHECAGIVAPAILDLAQQMLEPRNNRAHALLEHNDPQTAMMGGLDRGIERLSSGHYQIEPYRGDARNVISVTYKILSGLYGPSTK